MEDFNFDLLEDAEESTELKQIVSEQDKENLLQILYQTTFDADQQVYLSMQINNCEDADEFKKLKRNLLMNRIERKDRAAMGFTYSMTDISEAIRHMNNCKRRKIQLIKL